MGKLQLKNYRSIVLNIYDLTFDKSSKNYAIFIDNLADFYKKNMANYDKSLVFNLKALNVFKQYYGENDEDYLISLNNLALLYRDRNKFELSDKSFLDLLELIEKKNGKNSTIYSNKILDYALLAEKENNLVKADSLYKVAIDINTKINADNSEALHSQAEYYTKIRLYKSAEMNYLNILLKIDKKNNLYFISMLELFSIYTSTGDFYKAERVLEKLENENTSNVILKLRLLDYKALLYKKQNNFDKYSKVVYEASEIRLATYDKDDPEISKALNNLAIVAFDLEEFEEAKNLLFAALTIHEKKYGLHNKLAAAYLHNIGDVYCLINDFDKAEFYLKKALIIREEILGVYNEDFLATVNKLTSLYFSYNCYDNALELYEQYMNKNNLNLYSETDPIYLETLLLYGGIYKAKNNFEKTNENFIKYLNILNTQIKQNVAIMSLTEFNYLKNDFFDETGLIFSFLNDFPTQYPEINIGCYENELLLKNLSLRNQQRIKNSIQKSGDVALQDKYQNYTNNKQQLAKLQELPIDKRPANFDTITNTTEQLEKELTRQSATFADAKKAFEIHWQDVAQKLQPKELAIELVAFNYYNKKWTDSIVYAAFVVGKNFKTPKYIPLFEQKQLVGLLAKDSIGISKQYTNKAISDLFFNSLEQEFQDIKTIYLAPAGLGYQIDFAALPIGNTTLGEKYKVHILGASSEIVNYKTGQLDKNTGLELLLYGAIDYDKIPEKKEKDALENKNGSDFKALASRSGSNGFNYLKGTKNEINQIQQSGQANGFKATIIDDRKASKESIKQLDGRTMPYVLHLATHCFFFENPKTILPDSKASEIQHNKNVTAEDPMLRSGLIFAGANKFWGKPITAEIADNGVLTASEISNLDLSACQLVVLSACETGLGDINGSDGVFGLQRAFKMAGVKNIIMSMWKVPDAQTAELFTVFYQSCFSGKSIHEAFQEAQSVMKQKYEPYYWAGFVLME